ncbi:hypothetical protein Sjap_006250 [Stephania japonica]|uniref:Plantacyanin n=1 Tax=Stephania japonica TaxID=461633 RepID=A0AAP0PJK1_9MAGN
MAMGRGNGIKVLLLTFLVMAWSNHSDASTSHTVGDSQGWGFSVSYNNWADGHSFAAGDTLVFNYQQGMHNTVPVSLAGFRNCKASASELSKAQSSGNDKFTLKKGANYFLCSYQGHCSSGMKIQVNAN